MKQYTKRFLDDCSNSPQKLKRLTKVYRETAKLHELILDTVAEKYRRLDQRAARQAQRVWIKPAVMVRTLKNETTLKNRLHLKIGGLEYGLVFERVRVNRNEGKGKLEWGWKIEIEFEKTRIRVESGWR